MRRYVVDAGVLFLYFIDDERVKPYLDDVVQGRAQAFIFDVNLAKYYYKTCEKLGEDLADVWYHKLDSSVESAATDEELTRKAGEKKCKYRSKLSLRDCFSLAPL